MKEITFDFIKGNISFDEYVKLSEKDNFEFLQSLVKDGEMATCITQSNTGNVKVESIPYVAKKVLSSMCEKGTLAAKVDFFSEICRLVKEAFPNEIIVINTYLLDAFNYILLNTPNYIGGTEAEQVLYEIYKSILCPNTPSGRAEYKRIIASLFRCKNKKPRWIQEPEWPVCCGKPMTFVKEFRDNEERKHYLFESCFFDENIEIIQFF